MSISRPGSFPDRLLTTWEVAALLRVSKFEPGGEAVACSQVSRLRRTFITTDVTIPYVGRCLGSGKPPREGSDKSQAGGTSGVCVACSGRFDLDNGAIVEHETAPEDERESVDDAQG